MSTAIAQPIAAQPAVTPSTQRKVPNTALQVIQMFGTVLLGGYALLSLVGAVLLATQSGLIGFLFPIAAGGALVSGLLAVVFYAVLGYFVNSIALLEQIAHNTAR